MDEYNWKHQSSAFHSEMEARARSRGVSRTLLRVVKSILAAIWIIGLLIAIWVATPA